jgi:hypothetical protein
MALALTRRTLLEASVYSAAALWARVPRIYGAEPGAGEGWTSEWDKALLLAEIVRIGKNYDEAEQMVRGHRGPEYNYQTNLRSMTVHATRDSIEYASLLLYFDEPALIGRAASILKRVLPLQVRDPTSPYFGLWSYYIEEPLEKMNSADFNWADFIGALLLNILFLHERRISADLARSIRTAVQNAAACIRKRNVSLYYTNIAFQGTYVTLATGELLKDAELLDYAKQRFVRLEATVNESGSFAEYNSPTYMAVTLENISRIMMFVHDPGSREIAAKLNALAWKQIAEHWHAPTKQLSGPMSRAYSNDIGSPMWIQKGTNNRVRFETLADLAKKAPGGEATIPTVDFRCPEDLVLLFGPTPRHQVREVFVAGTTLVDNLDVSKRAKAVAPIEGTTLLTPAFCLGSANRSDFWIQRRPLIAYWGDATRPPKCLQMRVIKDDYDFTSALLYSAQNQGSVLGSIRFRSDGGDKHPSLDRIKNGTFSLTQMRMELFFGQWQASNRILLNGKPGPQEFTAHIGSRVAIDTGSVKLFFQVHAAHFVEAATQLRFVHQGSDAGLSVDLMKADAPQIVHWDNFAEAGCDFTLMMSDARQSLEALDAVFASSKFNAVDSAGTREITWSCGDEELTVKTASRVLPIAAMDEAYEARIDGKPYPLARLDQAPIHY